ncbi:MAG: ABC transporter ATP-binding protein [Bacteroides sp.]
MNALELRNVTKKYREFTFDNVTLELPQGCVLGLVGENGAGKTTMMKLILGSIKKDAGDITVLGTDIRKENVSVKQDIGVVLADDSFPEMITAAQVGKIMASVYKNWDAAKYDEYIKKFGLEGKKKYKEYSRGMKMKLSIAVAMSHNAKLLLLDEATSGLDPVVRDELLDMFNEFTRDETHSILISSHITSDLEKICDYIAFMHNGKLVMCEEKDELLKKYGILHCTKEVFGELAAGAVIGHKESEYGVEALVARDRVPATFDISPANIDDIIVYLSKNCD